MSMDENTRFLFTSPLAREIYPILVNYARIYYPTIEILLVEDEYKVVYNGMIGMPALEDQLRVFALGCYYTLMSQKGKEVDTLGISHLGHFGL